MDLIDHSRVIPSITPRDRFDRTCTFTVCFSINTVSCAASNLVKTAQNRDFEAGYASLARLLLFAAAQETPLWTFIAPRPPRAARFQRYAQGPSSSQPSYRRAPASSETRM